MPVPIRYYRHPYAGRVRTYHRTRREMYRYYRARGLTHRQAWALAGRAYSRARRTRGWRRN